MVPLSSETILEITYISGLKTISTGVISAAKLLLIGATSAVRFVLHSLMDGLLQSVLQEISLK